MSVFALDIGTRKIAGLVMNQTEQGFHVDHAYLKEQQPGAMEDGQIHDIAKVAKVISQVTNELATQTGQNFSKAAVAAAGRALRTERGRASLKLAITDKITREQVKTLELEAVQQALAQLNQDSAAYSCDNYFCVGYSVVRYFLEDQPITSLVGHQGNTAAVEVIATFLPRVVVDSLASALEAANLEMASLTLEPIAAMHLVVPHTMRMLNIALVDIGAGTADIAVSREGTIENYGMVPMAGDEITQALAERYLLDFMVAEQLKRNLTREEDLVCEDAFGNQLNLTRTEVMETIQPSVQLLAERIGQEILAINKEKPKGILLIGGGSLTLGLAKELAKYLEVPNQLVKVRERDNLKQITGEESFTGPHVITPLAIGATHLSGLAMQLQTVTVNNQRLQFLQLANGTVGDALLHAGFAPRQLWGRPGQAITVEINRRTVTIPGTLGKPANVLVNGEQATFDSPISSGDHIQLEPPQDGQPARATLGDIIDRQPDYQVTINGKQQIVGARALVNGREKDLDYRLRDKDQITLEEVSTIGSILQQAGYAISPRLSVYLNGQPKTFEREYRLLVDGKEQSLDSPLNSGAHIQYHIKPVYLKQVLDNWETQGIEVSVNGTPISLPSKNGKPLVNGRKVGGDYQLQEGDRITHQDAVRQSEYILSDIFLVYQPTEVKSYGGSIVFKVNGKVVGYTHPLKNGDVIEIEGRKRG